MLLDTKRGWLGGTLQSMRRHDLVIVNFPSFKSKVVSASFIQLNVVTVFKGYSFHVDEPFSNEWAKYDKKAKYEYLSLKISL